MKKIALYSLLAGAGLLMASCTDDYKDWSEPQGNAQTDAATVSFEAAPVGGIDLRTAPDTIQIFNPTVVSNKACSTTYDVAIYNTDRTDSVVIKGFEGGKALRAQVQGALVALYGTQEVQRVTPMNLTAYIMIDGTAVRKRVEGVNLTATPKFQELPPVWYILGNCVGRGSGVNHKTMGLYTSTVAMYVNPYNYEELVYASYFCDNAQFKIILEAGNKENVIGADGEGNIIYQESTPEGGSIPGNITIKDGGYYQVTVNVVKKTLEITPITHVVKAYGSMLMNETALAVITTNSLGENHDWLGDATLSADGEITFTGEGDDEGETFTTTWGGNAFPAGKAIKAGNPIPAKAGNYKVVFNDLLGVYRFIEK